MIIEVNNANFNDFIKNNPICVVDLYANWCGPCRMLGSILDNQDEFVIGKVNVDENEELCQKFNVMSIPRILVFKDEKIVADFLGFDPNIMDKIRASVK